MSGPLCTAREEGTGLQCQLLPRDHVGRQPLHAARLSRRFVVRWNDYRTIVEGGPLRPDDSKGADRG